MTTTWRPGEDRWDDPAWVAALREEIEAKARAENPAYEAEHADQADAQWDAALALFGVTPLSGPGVVEPKGAPLVLDLKEWDESLHPRDDHGRFGSGGGTSSSSTSIADMAHTVANAAASAEPSVSADIAALNASTGSTPQGWPFRLKTEASLTAKIVNDSAKPGVTPEMAASKIKDGLRYTMTYPADQYSAGIQTSLDTLTSKGYTVDAARNTWDLGTDYRGVNTNLLTPDGYRFELQFHTPESYQYKEFGTHDLYAEQKGLVTTDPTSPRIAQIQQTMVDGANALGPTPPGLAGVSYLQP